MEPKIAGKNADEIRGPTKLNRNAGTIDGIAAKSSMYHTETVRSKNIERLAFVNCRLNDYHLTKRDLREAVRKNVKKQTAF